MNRKDRRAEAARQRHAKAMEGMELRFGGRTLIVEAFVNTSEDPAEVVRRVQPAARGPKAVMCIVTAGVHEADTATSLEAVEPLWASQGIETLFGGRTIVVTIYANTDEEAVVISRRVMAAANTPADPAVLEACKGQLAVIMTVSDAPIEETNAMWKHFFKILNAQKDGPN